MKAIAAVAVLNLLVACGGGGEPEPSQVVACVPKTPVRLLMFGDSTFGGAGASQAPNGDLTYAPAPIIQRAMDLRFGAGAVQVLNYSVMASSTGDLIAGRDGVNAPWPQPLVGDLAIVSHGVVDAARGVSLGAFRANMKAIASAPVVMQTPNPTYREWENPGFAQAVRDAAAAADRPLADVHAYMSGLANPSQYFPDGVHPNDAGYQLIVNNVTMPALVPLVDKLRCK